MDVDPKILEARKKLMERMGDVRTGGKGTARRKKRAVHKATTTDDKRLQSTLKRLSVNNIPGIEEVNLFKNDNTVIHFSNPRVQASIPANTYVVSGTAETKKLTDMLPAIMTQLGMDNIPGLTKITQFGKGKAGEAEGDDDVPDLIENFEEVSKSK